MVPGEHLSMIQSRRPIKLGRWLALLLAGLALLGAGMVLRLGTAREVDLPSDGRLEVPLLPTQALWLWVHLVPEAGYSTVHSTVDHIPRVMERSLWIGAWYHDGARSTTTRLATMQLPVWALGLPVGSLDECGDLVWGGAAAAWRVRAHAPLTDNVVMQAALWGKDRGATPSVILVVPAAPGCVPLGWRVAQGRSSQAAAAVLSLPARRGR